VVEPFEDDEFAAEVGKLVGGSLGVRQGEVGRLLAGFHGGGGSEGPTDGQDGKEEVFSHPANIPWNVGWSRMVSGKWKGTGNLQRGISFHLPLPAFH